MACKCDEIGDYSHCFKHGDNSEWSKEQENAERRHCFPANLENEIKRHEREKLILLEFQVNDLLVRMTELEKKVKLWAKKPRIKFRNTNTKSSLTV